MRLIPAAIVAVGARRSVPWWVIVLPIVAALIVIVVVAVILWAVSNYMHMCYFISPFFLILLLSPFLFLFYILLTCLSCNSVIVLFSVYLNLFKKYCILHSVKKN